MHHKSVVLKNLPLQLQLINHKPPPAVLTLSHSSMKKSITNKVKWLAHSLTNHDVRKEAIIPHYYHMTHD